MIGIYKITNPKGKIYIGQSTNIEKRIHGYENLRYCSQQIKLYNSLKKYTPNTHIFEIIEECLVEELNEKERYWQDFYDVIGENGLNLLLTKTTDRCGFMSKETRQKMSKSKMGNKITESGKKKLSEKMKGEKNPSYGKFGKEHPTYNFRKYTEKRKLARCGSGNPFIRVILNIETGIFYYGLKEIVNLCNYNITQLGNRLRGSTPNNTFFRYV